MISDCHNIGNRNLKKKLMDNMIDIEYVITKNQNGNYWAMLKDGHHDLNFILEKILKTMIDLAPNIS